MDAATASSVGVDEMVRLFGERLASVGGHSHEVADTAAAARLIVSMAGERVTDEVIAAEELTAAEPELR